MISTGENAAKSVAGGLEKCLETAATLVENKLNVRVVSISSPSVESSSMLIVAELNTVELFDASTTSDCDTWKGKINNLRGETIAEVRVSANYIYQID